MTTRALAVGLGLAAVLPLVGLLNGPVYAPLVFAAGAAGLVALRRAARVDWTLLLLAGLFIGWSWLGLAWTVSAHRTVAGALQASLVFSACLAFLAAARLYPSDKAGRLATVLTAAGCVGMVLLLSDVLDGYRVLRAADGAGTWPTKYNRGIDYSFLLLLPAIGFLRRHGRWALCAAAAVAVIVTILAGSNMTARVALVATLGIWALARVAPMLAAGVLGGVAVLEALFLPFVMPLVDRLRPAIAPHLKISGVERLEIWDYLSAHVLQRPWLGWGLWTSRLLPASAAEKASFIKATGSGIYPHNQFLELWVELGVPGALIGLAFVLVVLRRIARLEPELRPEAFAAATVALLVASSGFEVTTDSWWAALVASGALFALFRQPADA